MKERKKPKTLKKKAPSKTKSTSILAWGGINIASTIITKGVNIIVNSTNSFEVASTSNPVTISGGLQIINNNGARFPDVPSNVVADKIWILNSAKNSGGSLDVTDVTGIFRISDKMYAYTEYKSDSPVYFGTGIITLPEGEHNILYADSLDEIKQSLGVLPDTAEGLIFNGWNVSGNTITPSFISHAPTEKNYYVLAGATGDGRSPENPAGSVESAVLAINADLPYQDDTAHVFIMQKEDVETLEYGSYSQSVSNFTPWIAGRKGANEVYGYPIYSHKAKIIVSSYNYELTGVKNHLIFTDYIGAMHHLRLMGPTDFKNIILLGSKVPSVIVARGYSVNFENTEFKTSNANGFDPTSQHTRILDGYVTLWSVDGSGTNASSNQEISIDSTLTKINSKYPSLCLLGDLHSGIFPSSIDRTITYRFNNKTDSSPETQEVEKFFLIPGSIIDARVIAAKQYIDRNVLKNISCEDIAKQCYISPRHLNRLFMEHERLSIKQYINAKKIAEIEKMLKRSKTTKTTIKEISSYFGFCSEYYFNAFFKKNTGMTPGEYRKSIE